MDVSKLRKTEYPIDPIFTGRWSPRAFDGKNLDNKTLMSLFEAARWAPSSYNNQSWRFLYARTDTPHWKTFLGLLGEFNQAWCKNAGALIVVVSKKTFDHNGEPSVTHSFDTGAAWMSLALQAHKMGLITHGMQGFDYGKARTALKVPEDHDVEAMVAVGRMGKREDLPAALQERETPSMRKPLKDIAREGAFW